MSVKYAPVADQIIDLVGGPDNVSNVYHCQTRLRFTLKDESKADAPALSALDEVAQALISGGMFQIVIGTHVKDVYDEVEKSLKARGVDVTESGSAESDNKGNILTRIIDFISSTFTPVIPALAGAGMVAALLSLLVAFGWVTTDSQTYTVFSFISNACFYFLPIFLAFSAAGKLGTNRILAAVVAAMMVHPVWTELVETAEPVSLFNVIPLTLATYSATVIPILLIVFVQSYFERLLERVIPNSIKIVVIPMLVFLVMGVLAFTILGPIGAFIGGYLADFFLWLTENAPWAPSLIVGSLLPVMVMFGVHTAVGPLGLLQLGQFGYDTIFGPGALCSNIAQGTAAAVVALRTKEAKFRQVATAGSITAFMGITEPALYGVNLPKRYPLIAAMIGGGAGGLYAGLTATRRFAVGSSGLPAVPMYIGDDTLTYFINILVALVIAIAVTAVVAVMLSFRFEKSDATPDDAAIGASLTVEADSVATPTGSPAAGSSPVGAITEVTDLVAPCQGSIVALEAIDDPAFSSGALGQGVGVEPVDGQINSPCAGTVIAATRTNHAYGIRTDDGTEILVHVGVDTVRMKGEGFTPAVAKGDRVTAGQRLVDVDLEAVAKAQHPATVIVVVTKNPRGETVNTIATGDVSAGDPILALPNDQDH
ncbi:beta-glucoside-specific PTS transporter subunit IIABC [Corynebacterium glyciniphilum]|uniref:beta-glucoside-specific PTS transporter subunit IIABC n=1 Tax=Corynebacterium glyciniphilum TaxID=1404244 RepID=UPI003DA07FD5